MKTMEGAHSYVPTLVEALFVPVERIFCFKVMALPVKVMMILIAVFYHSFNVKILAFISIIIDSF